MGREWLHKPVWLLLISDFTVSTCTAESGGGFTGDSHFQCRIKEKSFLRQDISEKSNFFYFCLTWCKLGGIPWNQLIHGHCEPGVGKSLAELQWTEISLSEYQRYVNTKFTFGILRGIHVLQTYCPKAPSPSKLLQENWIGCSHYFS